MERKIKISDEVTVGAQPAEEEIEQLREAGFRSVVNLRTDNEDDQPMSPAEEGERVRAEGMNYLHIPVSMDRMSEEKVDRFRDQFMALPSPVFVHCKSGMRSGAFAIMHMASERGQSGDQAIERAMDLGFECDKPEIKDFVRNYVDRHRAA